MQIFAHLVNSVNLIRVDKTYHITLRQSDIALNLQLFGEHPPRFTHPDISFSVVSVRPLEIHASVLRGMTFQDA